MGGVCLSVNGGEYFGIFLSAYFVSVFVDDAVGVTTLLHYVVVVVVEVAESAGDVCASVVCPLAFSVAAEVLYGEGVVVSEHGKAAFACAVYGAEAVEVDDAVVCSAAACFAAYVCGDVSALGKFTEQLFAFAEFEGVSLFFVVEGVEISPVDEVACLVANVLCGVSGIEVFVSVGGFASVDCFLCVVTNAHFCAGLQVDAYVVLFAVVGFCLV